MNHAIVRRIGLAMLDCLPVPTKMLAILFTRGQWYWTACSPLNFGSDSV
jgi:hypothetical protein